MLKLCTYLKELKRGTVKDENGDPLADFADNLNRRKIH
jgi:hypothetical protein